MSKHPRRHSLRVSLALLAGTLALLGNVAPATAARTMSLNLSAAMHLIGRPGHVLNEQGSFSGTLSGSIDIHFVSASSTTGAGTFVAYTQGGSISGETRTSGHVVGASVYYTGTMSITKGTGRWAHAAGSGLRFSGVINRHNFHSTGHMQGSIRV
jgi:hypothetical protein